MRPRARAVRCTGWRPGPRFAGLEWGGRLAGAIGAEVGGYRMPRALFWRVHVSPTHLVTCSPCSPAAFSQEGCRPGEEGCVLSAPRYLIARGIMASAEKRSITALLLSGTRALNSGRRPGLCHRRLQ
ncbi:hypothetical protein MRX96_019584 [Rhipicephalus microplus]